jgi:hypothetical protein
MQRQLRREAVSRSGAQNFVLEKKKTEQTELIESRGGWGLNFFTMSNVSGVENTVGK